MHFGFVIVAFIIVMCNKPTNVAVNLLSHQHEHLQVCEMKKVQTVLSEDQDSDIVSESDPDSVALMPAGSASGCTCLEWLNGPGPWTSNQ